MGNINFDFLLILKVVTIIFNEKWQFLELTLQNRKKNVILFNFNNINVQVYLEKMNYSKEGHKHSVRKKGQNMKRVKFKKEK